jgi:hypothetical protein
VNFLEKKTNALTTRREIFVQELLKGNSQRQAYYVAFPRSREWKADVVDRRASELWRKEEIKARYAELSKTVVKKLELEHEHEEDADYIVSIKNVIKELALVAFSNYADYAKLITTARKIRVFDDILQEHIYVEDTSSIEQYLVLTDTVKLGEKSRVISGIKTTKHGISIQLHDKLKALEILGKYLGMFDSIEERKLVLLSEKLELEKRKLGDSGDEASDDGFLDALKETAKEVWDSDKSE